MDIQSILQNHSFEVQGLLRKHKIAGDLSVDTINKAYNLKGEQFMMELLKIITPTSSFLGIGKGNGFLGLGKSTKESASDEDEDEDIADTATVTAPKETGRFWTFWEKLLGTAVDTSKAIGQSKANLSTPIGADGLPIPLYQETTNTNLLWLVAGGFVVLILIILIFKK